MLDKTFSSDAPRRRWYWPFRRRAPVSTAFYEPYGDALPPHLQDEPLAPLKKPRGKWWWFSRGVAAVLFLLILLIAYLAITAPLSKSLQPIAPPQITLLTSDGQPIARNGAVVEEPVVITELPDHVVNAFLAIEDRRFYSHWGVDPRGLARAALSNATGSGMTQGGSTITQQLAKLTFLTPERSLTRKAREMLIAFWMEARLSKDEILQRYLSNVYFGDNVYGLRAASLHYYYRKPENLKPEQAIMLAGLVQAPSRLAPTRNPDLAAKRAKLVKAAMVNGGFLTQAEADKLPNPVLDVRTKNTVPTGTYFADWAMPRARALSEMSYSKLTITTTLDSRLQKIAGNVVSRAPLGKAQVALVAMRPDGEVVAMIGGRDYKQSAFNRVTQAKRQPGSTFKLFVWLAALRADIRPEDMVDDSPITKGGYLPKNAGEKYRGEITLKEAFAKSSNVTAVRLFQQVGDEAVIREARNLGVTSKLAEDDPSLALGTSTMTLLELTAAYAGVANNSWPVEPYAFQKGEQSWAAWLFDWPGRYGNSTHERMEDMLRAAVNEGTGRNARLSIPNYGKTGTSQNNRDALFVGYAGDLVVGVWVGNDDNTPLKGISGGSIPARIWRDFMRQAVLGAGPVSKPKPNPDGPIKPLDVPDAQDLEDVPIDLGDSEIRINGGDSVSISTEIGGIPVDLRLDNDGVAIESRREEAPAATDR
ncbi:transglycosylase domain-containing protein [Parasphingorhabdus cellanae]|uniref:peptidoglycan glycosyltransferase n=1 Tax=Parasphingorhabdus cellanae TaxID=2806553 RepID=A0ABX7T3W3_9SPHN|nr:PBP1A family penicillin-binding protein [Parasphingorhabdus cellanae]QTD55505.1 PBP1A family penicillin-binding protein [Parasphingorhabdus cellanae]